MSTTSRAAAPSLHASRGERVGRRMRDLLPPFVVFVLFIAAWWLLAATVYGDQNFLLPRPWAVAEASIEHRDTLLSGLRLTFIEAVSGFVGAIVVGMAAAMLMGLAKPLERSLYPYAVLLQTVPIVAVAPVIVLWFGYGTRSVIVIAFMIALFPIINNTLLGLLSADRNHLDLFRMHNASRMVVFGKLRLPGALPSIFAGLRISAGLSVIGAIVGEFIIGSGGEEGGLGVKVLFAQSRLATDLLFAEVLAATLLGFSFFVVVSAISNRLLRSWHESALKADA
ncbi:ABC transporter permease [Nocardioides marmoribigeumensis]|uniref:NitT/TauT family transport system permease protein n=1 Tax=Nocardioides marmoribigeumensis TaxID=433649 RepID=A0ABU2BUV8_9ACTN|nr:ABC transporter permease [Nocardioides marmoribigeumensis]MDR7362420.1 NitT/TauT family transport system permease protein [Nocardioides marmoribigeumensis]